MPVRKHLHLSRKQDPSNGGRSITDAFRHFEHLLKCSTNQRQPMKTIKQLLQRLFRPKPKAPEKPVRETLEKTAPKPEAVPLIDYDDSPPGHKIRWHC